jgi:hypothetical protein
MSTPRRFPGSEPLQGRAVLRSAGEVGRRLLDRAESQHLNGVKPFSKARTSFRSIDDLAPSWWGLTLLTGGSDRDQMTLAARIAFETASARGRVLWLSLSGEEESPIFRLLTGMASVPARSLFVDRQLTALQWALLAAALDDLEELPIQVADVHGLSLGEVRAACLEAMGAETLDLVVVDGIDEREGRLLGTLEGLSDELDVPILAVVSDGTDAGSDAVTRSVPLRRGSLLLHLQREPSAAGVAVTGDSIRLRLDVARVGEGPKGSSVLSFDPRYRWLEELGSAQPPGERS